MLAGDSVLNSSGRVRMKNVMTNTSKRFHGITYTKLSLK